MNKSEITYGIPQSKEEVIAAYKFIKQELEIKSTHPRQEEYYLNVFENFPSLLVIAKSQEKIVGYAFTKKIA